MATALAASFSAGAVRDSRRDALTVVQPAQTARLAVATAQPGNRTGDSHSALTQGAAAIASGT
ncbi:MAG: hypothetical protein QM736_22930 [Vicinamibacterales bacterium]